MERLTRKERQEIVDALIEKGANLPCPRCRNKSFTLLNGYFHHIIHESDVIRNPTAPSASSVAVVCDRCGYMNFHTLTLLKKDENKNELK
jgi:predicted nucleic-acid-binding Zn-ribbon protein